MNGGSTFVLVPGAGGDSWYWHRVIPLLREAGHEVIAPDLPASDEDAGLDEYTRVVAQAIGDRSGVIVVAQSMGAYSGTMVCERAEVRSLILLAPMIPAAGETPGEWWSATGQDQAEREGHDPDAPFDVRWTFLHDLPSTVLEDVLARGGPAQSARPFADPFPLRAWPRVPTRVIAGLRDRLFPFEFLRALSMKRLGIEPEAIDAGHLIALSKPKELADLLLAG